jgi:SAM-dependent methyltransferase
MNRPVRGAIRRVRAAMCARWHAASVAAGRREGMDGVLSRRRFLDDCAAASSILEIGAFCNPLLSGGNVFHFDVLDREGLRRRARTLGLPEERVPEIHYVGDGGDLGSVDRTFAVVFSSHCIEHQPDLVHHLQQVEKLLEPGGSYRLLIPDKNYCFDHYLPESTIAQVLDAHRSRLRRHTLASVIEHRALTTHNDPARHWRGDHGEQDPTTLARRVRAAVAEFEAARGGYVDVHAWQFTPESFRCICVLLNELGHTRLRPLAVHATPYGSNEFGAVLGQGRE